jgi:hypothetical protein
VAVSEAVQGFALALPSAVPIMFVAPPMHPSRPFYSPERVEGGFYELAVVRPGLPEKV